MSVDPVTAGLNLGTEIIKLIDNAMKFFPDYEQKKREEYHYHHERYINEMSKEYHYRDDNRIDYHRDQMITLLKDFSVYLEAKVAQKESGENV